MRLWVCIPVHNRINLTLKCLESLARQSYRDFSIVVCDDGSTDGTSERIRALFPGVILLAGDGNLWWTGAINCCVKYALTHATNNSDCIITLNDDLEVPENYLSMLMNASVRHPNSLITSVEYDIKTRHMNSPGSRHSWFTARSRRINPAIDHDPLDKTVAWITEASGRGTLIPIEVFRKIGLFDQRHLPHYGSDYDFSYKARRAGYRILVCLEARVFSHVEKTGITRIRESFSLQGFYQYLTNIKSPANYKARWWLAINNCPRLLLPTFLLLDYFFVIGSYFKFHLFRHWRGRNNPKVG